LIPDITESIGFKGPRGITGGGGSAISIVLCESFVYNVKR
jgi:hypothetical protein